MGLPTDKLKTYFGLTVDLLGCNFVVRQGTSIQYIMYNTDRLIFDSEIQNETVES